MNQVLQKSVSITPAMARRIELWPIDRLVPYAKNPRTHSEEQVAQIAASIVEFGFTAPILVASDAGILAGHGRLLAARKLRLPEVPVVVLDHLSETQRRAYVIADNQLALNAGWNLELLRVELESLKENDFDLDLIGFSDKELDDLLADPEDDERANAAPPLPENAVSRPGDLWVCGERRNQHRVLCADATSPEAVAKLLGERRPHLMVTDPPYGIELDSEWRDRAGLNGCGPAEASYMKHRTEGHTETTISGDTRADWSEAFELVPSLQIVYVWHASIFTREVLNGLLRIGFLYPQQIIWNKGRTVLTRTHYWYQHEPCWYLRKKNAPWFGKAGENSTIWDSPSPKFIMGGSGDEKYDHPTQKPVELMRRPILNHTKRGELVYEPFLGSGTTLAAAELTERVCYGLELDGKYADVIVQRWQTLAGKQAKLEGDGRTFEAIAEERRKGGA
ncbi:MAG: DNA methyltransferase [Bryobacteraceae bacterium]